MKNLKKWQTIALLLVTVSTFTASAKSPSVNSQLSVNEVHQKVATAKKTAQKSTVQAQLNNAQKAGKAAFVVVTGTGVTDASKATTIANNAAAKYKNAVVIELNRDDVANTSLVSKFGLSGAPLPLILVISPKGAPVGGFVLKDATVEKIVDIIPSPKADIVYAAINNKKPVFILLAKNTNTDRASMLANCKAANKQLRVGGVIIEIDPTDAKEQKLLKTLGAVSNNNTSYVYVFNAAGQATGTFSGKAETASLVAAATKVIRSGGCCPGGAPAGGCGAK